MKRRNVVDLHYRRTWPRGFRDFVTANSSQFDGDHGLEPSQERRAVEMLGSHLIRAYHCTRLTRREVASVCESGLQPLSRELAMQRLTDAVSDGYLTPQQAAFYTEKADPDDPGRNGMVWLFTERHSLSDSRQVACFLENWGGEGINMDVRPHTPEMDLLEQIGTPTVVIANIVLVLHCDHARPGSCTPLFSDDSDGTPDDHRVDDGCRCRSHFLHRTAGTAVLEALCLDAPHRISPLAFERALNPAG